ncbi:hypothetical protein [Alkalimarinus sediminis]|uniref:Uncharacterized protein n=1 Tax=Alkalimarinus sediminis TaxID=1632866 RepID=A0A9E8KQU8_9ALTE|nr:hypothetical protein [Alkalimarinus sediminis]UZW75232.1 hypothetical protein NNL22_01085 [Alkalimarinus sediminis]
MNQIWDLDAGFLDDELLTEQMRLLSGLINDQTNRDKRLPAHWISHEDALVVRLNQLIAEMRLRDIATPEYQTVYEGTVIWPARLQEPLKDQLQRLAERCEQGKKGRIGIPSNEREIWANYRYSVMARSHNAFISLGQQVTSRQISFDDLLLEVVHATRAEPYQPDVRNALQQMWGYVSANSYIRPNEVENNELLAEVQLLAKQTHSEYLLKSTSLGELAFWC